MKTHELAKALKVIAKILEKGPNQDFFENPTFIDKSSKKLSSDEIAVNVHTLLALSKIEKKQWLQFIQEFQFPISYNDRDSARNILGKIMNYLEANPNAASELKKKAKSSMSSQPSALTQALDILLRDY